MKLRTKLRAKLNAKGIRLPTGGEIANLPPRNAKRLAKKLSQERNKK